MVPRNIMGTFSPRMDTMRKSLLCLTCIICSFSYAYSFLPESIFPTYNAYKAYREKEFDKTQSILEKQQVDNPNDPLINYNLGTTYYKQKQYDEAKENFFRSAQYAFGKDNLLLEKSYFNLGNCFYKNTLAMLPESWEKGELDKTIVEPAVKEIKQAIEKYKHILQLKPKHKKAKNNTKAAEEILQKLMKQQQKKNQKKQDDKKQDPKQNNEQQNKQQAQKQPQKKQGQKKLQVFDLEKRKIKNLLAKLEQEEKKLQKKLFKQKIKNKKPAKNQYQKPW